MRLTSFNSTSSYSAWQKVILDDLSRLFYVFNTSTQQTERVAAFRIDDSNVISGLLSTNPQRLRIHLGADPAHDFNVIPDDKPGSKFYLEGLKSGGNVTYPFEYDPDPKFLDLAKYDSGSGVNQIPPAGAILFARAWLEMHDDKLGTAFEGPTSANLVQRVRYYTFSDQETASILAQLGNISADPVIYLYLGASIGVTGHPFAFRPVLEISSTTAAGESTFFDFSSPCPPICDQ